jgi:predicted glycosyltransferase
MVLTDINREPVCVMAYSHDGFGLGHLRRNTNIAARLVQDVPDSNALLVVGCPRGAFFESPPGVDFIKVPSIVKVDTGVHQPLNLRIDLGKIKALRASTILKVAEIYQPHLFLVDHVPTGVWAELLPTLQMLRERENPPQIVFGMRDIIDTPEVVREQWNRQDIYKAIRTYYDEVLIYGCRSVFDAASEYGLDVELPGRVSYSGYVCSGEPYKTRDQMREQLRLGREKLIVVTAGGGRDAYSMLRTCVDAFRLLVKDVLFEAIIIAGPLMPPEEKECLEREARGLNVRVLSQVFENLNYVNAADLVVTMAGYNSLVEILQLRKKALVIPRLGPSAEQVMRARLFEQRGLIDVIYPRELSPKRLAERMLIDFERRDYPVHDQTIELDGAAKVATHLTQLLGKQVYGTAAD